MHTYNLIPYTKIKHTKDSIQQDKSIQARHKNMATMTNDNEKAI